MGVALRIAPPPTLNVRVFQKAEFAATRVSFDGHGHGRTNPIAAEDSYILSLQLRDLATYDLWVGGRHVPTPPTRRGTFTFVDLRQPPTADLRDPFDSLHLYLPRTALDAMADDRETPRLGELRLTPGLPVDDPVIRHLGESLLPALDAPAQTPRLFVDHVALALHAHVAQKYGSVRGRARVPTGGLAAWQERRVKELLLTRLDGEISLSELARECGLSRSHFARAFRATTGQPAHRWLLAKRVERARELLQHSALPISEITRLLGFADQSHFTRVFGRTTGVTPAAWRRRRG